MMKLLALMGTVALGAGLALAGVLPAPAGETLDDALPGFIIGARADEPCPADSITGQYPSACAANHWYFYSDTNFCSAGACSRLRCEDFPKTGVLNPADPNQWIGTIIWYGVNIGDPVPDGCSKGAPGTYQFRIRFYNDNAGVPVLPNVYEEIVTPFMADTGETVLFSGATIPATRWMYTAVLTTPRQMAKGWFSIQGTGTAGCYSLWEGSGADGGDNKFYQWFETGGTIPGPAITDKCDLDYCFGVLRRGACCHGATGNCEDNFLEHYCHAAFDLFYPDTMCDQLQPPCSNVMTGACCCPDGVCFILTHAECLSFQCPPPCPGDANCDGVRDFDDIDAFVAVLGGAPPCRFENLDGNGDGSINFDDINPFVSNLGVPCPTARTGGLWLGPGTTCDQCPCLVDCNSPTHQEQEPCGADTNGGCDSLSDPNDPNSPPDPNAWEDLGVLDPNHPTVLCGTVWADDGYRDTDWYKFRLPVQGTLSWETQSDIPLLSTPLLGDGDFGPPTIPANCGGSLWGYWNSTRAYLCHIGGVAPTDIFHGGVTYWFIAFPDDGSAIFGGYPCADGLNDYRITITTVAVVCNPCQGMDVAESEPACGPGYVDTFNAGCDAGSGFPVQAAVDPSTWYCGQSGTWSDPNGNAQVDYDWWKIVLSGSTRRRLQIQMRAGFEMRWELYSVPGSVCANKVRLDYYEFGACEANVSIYTPCLEPNNSTYYMRIVPTDEVSCTQWNHYRFQYAPLAEAPACTACSVVCTTSPDDACQTGLNDPETNAGCNAADPNNPARYMAFTAGDNTYGPKYCGRISTFTSASGSPAVDLDWFRYDQLAGRTKLVIRGKAMFRMSINIGAGCTDPNAATHGWDRPCKGTTTSATQTWTLLTPGTTYAGVIIYGNGGGDGTGEQPLKQLFFGLPCSDSRNTYELELQAQT